MPLHTHCHPLYPSNHPTKLISHSKLSSYPLTHFISHPSHFLSLHHTTHLFSFKCPSSSFFSPLHGHAWPPSYPSPCMPISPSYYTRHHLFSLYILPSICMGTMHATTLLCPPYPFFLTTFLSLHHILHAHFLSTCMKPCMESCISSPSHAHLTHSFINLSLIPHLHSSCFPGTIPSYPYQHPLTHSLIILLILFSLTCHLSHFPNLHHPLH